MGEIDLFNLDIRLLDPVFGAKDRDRANRKNADLGIFYLDGSDFKIVKIKGGWEILQKSIESVLNFDQFDIVYHPVPSIYRGHYYIVTDLIHKHKPTEYGFPKPKFRAISDRFIGEYTLGRLESDIMSAEEYVRVKQNMPLDDTGALGCSEESYKLQRILVNRLERYVKGAPQLIGMPKHPEGMYREVRLDNKFSRCIGNTTNYEKFLKGDDTPNSCLTICDMVVQYPKKEFYIVEVKVHYFQTGTHFHYSKSRRLANSQLARAALFFQKNYNVYPTLVRCLLSVDPNNKKLRVSHWKYFGGALHQVKI